MVTIPSNNHVYIYYRRALHSNSCMYNVLLYVYVLWRWNWSNRNLVYNYISASHDVRPEFHLLMGLTPRKRALGYLLLQSIRKIACLNRKNSSPGQRLYQSHLVHAIQYFERNYSTAQVRKKNIYSVFNVSFDNSYHNIDHVFPYFTY